MVRSFRNLNNFVALHLAHPIYKKCYNIMENEQDMPFQNEGGCVGFFINVQYDFEAYALQLFF
jgi:hypothetical protein